MVLSGINVSRQNTGHLMGKSHYAEKMHSSFDISTTTRTNIIGTSAGPIKIVETFTNQSNLNNNTAYNDSSFE